MLNFKAFLKIWSNLWAICIKCFQRLLLHLNLFKGSFLTTSNMMANEKEWQSWALIYINDVQSFVKPRSIAKLKSYINTACICFWIFQNGHNDWIGADTHSALSKVGVDRKKTFQHISFHLPAITFFTVIWVLSSHSGVSLFLFLCIFLCCFTL